MGEARVGTAMAYVSSSMSIGLILGPVLGGVIYARRGYYAAFGLAFAFIAMDLVLRVILVEKKIAVRYAPSLSNAKEEDPQTLKLQAISPSSGDWERNVSVAVPSERARSTILSAAESKIPQVIRILKYPRLLVALLLSFVQALILSAFDATLPLYVNALFGFTALQAGIFPFQVY